MQKGFETQVNTLKAQIEAFGAEKEKAVNDAVAAAKAEAKAHEDEAISAVKKDFEVTEAIYNAKGKNVKAIKALIDPSKPVAEELERIQKSDSYLFGSSEGDIPGGTGKSYQRYAIERRLPAVSGQAYPRICKNSVFTGNHACTR